MQITKKKHRAGSRSTSVARTIEALESRRLLTSVVVNIAIDAVFPVGTGLVSLRNAVAIANASTTPTTVTFDPTVFKTAQTITLNGTQLELSNESEPTTITGPAAGITVSGNALSDTFLLDYGVSATLSQMTITQGRDWGIRTYGENTLTLNGDGITANGAAGRANGDTTGGVTLGSGTLKMSNDTVSNNTAYQGAVDIGGTATLTNVTLAGNTALNGGGIASYGTTTVIDSTISNNTATDYGGGIYNGGTLTLINDTITGNTATNAQGGGLLAGGTTTATNVTIAGNTAYAGGGINSEGQPTSFTITNSIIAGNSAVSSNDPDVAGGFNSLGYNLVGKTDGSTGFNAADLVGTAAKPLGAKLGALANNGGPTLTLLPLAGSPAIDHGLNAFIPAGFTTDQRGDARIVNGTVDIGAVEVGTTVVSTITATAPASQTATAGVSKAFTLGSFAATSATAPYAVTISWGDGSANTTFTATAAGVLAAQAHNFVKPGTDAVTVTVTDAAGHKSNTATFNVTVSPAVVTTIVLTAPAAQVATVGVSKTFTLGSFTATNATAPYTVVVNWGDGSATTTITATAAGTLAAQAHTFAKAGTDAVTVTITDGAAHKSNTATFNVVVSTVPTFSISGTVLNDANANGKQDAGETGLAGVKVYIDANKNGGFDTGETSVTTSSTGAFTFTGLTAGTYRIREVLPANDVQTAPSAGYFDVALSGTNAIGYLFADALATGSISGRVFGDTDGDGKVDNHELGLGLWQVYIDANNDGKLEATEKVVTTDASGNWSFTGLTAGTYTIRVVQLTGSVATKPTGGVLTVALTAGLASTNNLFGERSTV